MQQSLCKQSSTAYTKQLFIGSYLAPDLRKLVLDIGHHLSIGEKPVRRMEYWLLIAAWVTACYVLLLAC